MPNHMKALYALMLLVLLAGCAPGAAIPQATTPTEAEALPSATAEMTATIAPTATTAPTKAPTATKDPFAGWVGPEEYPDGVNPLTGLEVVDEEILERRPVIVKVENLPRADRPQYGVSKADLVYEYYTEEGTTRFATIFYGQDAELVAPVRSARFFDFNLIRMYKGVFVYGGAYYLLRDRLASAEFADRLLIETAANYPAVQRFDPGQRNFLSVNTAQLNDVLEKNKINNASQDLAGMAFSAKKPAGGQDAETVFARFSIAVYNRWDYDTKSGRYLRFSDTDNAVTAEAEQYEQLTDAQTDEPIQFENVVMLLVEHEIEDPNAGTEVVNMTLLGQGPAYIARDGEIYEVQWQRLEADDTLSLIDEDGEPFPFKPGQTWFEVMAESTTVDEEEDGVWRFDFVKDWQ